MGARSGRRQVGRHRRNLLSYAWHDETIAVIPVDRFTEAVDIVYEPDLPYRKQRDSLRREVWTGFGGRRPYPWPNVERALDVIGFFGDASSGPGFAGLQPPQRLARYSYRIDLLSRSAGILIVRPLYRLRRIIEGGTRDALFGSRLRRATRDLGDLPSRDIREAGEEATPVILVHGLASTGVELARQIEPLRIPTLRFEHDTFMSISRNAQDLAGIVRERFGTAEKITFICHSRGGLVARDAVDRIGHGMSAATAIHTFGTTHEGTPLADFAPFPFLMVGLNSLRNPFDAVRSAHRYLLPRYHRAPDGVQDMSPESPFIDRMRHGVHQSVLLNTWGGTFDPAASCPSWQRFFDRTCEPILPRPHDLVVPEQSSIGAGAPQGPLGDSCSHFDYLAKSEIHSYLQQSI